MKYPSPFVLISNLLGSHSMRKNLGFLVGLLLLFIFFMVIWSMSDQDWSRATFFLVMGIWVYETRSDKP